MNKCIASQDGICRNVLGFGVRCDGYSTQCKLKPTYDKFEIIAKNYSNNVRKMWGIVGDKE